MSRSFSLGLIGYPLGHSLSPHMHKAALESLSMQGDYDLYPVELYPQRNAKLENLFKRMRLGEIHGLNVTIPHKSNVIEFLDELTPTAESIGAVNTIFERDNLLIGDNTDAPAFLNEIHNLKTNLSHKQALVLGAGGSARAVAYALVNEGWQVNIVARKLQQAEDLVEHFGEGVTALSWDLKNFQELGLACSLIVNTTPLGMAPNPDASPWPEDLPMPAGVAIYDLVYNPPTTQFVQTARKRGLVAHTGEGMLVEQAALAFETWTGHNAPRDIMRQVLDEQLSRSKNPDVLDKAT
ncbi:MAG: shikimate dehydrogenase [Chloroflexi bacterium]|nr:shikimate dehydrogenase [Chloroflexota bacterium]